MPSQLRSAAVHTRLVGTEVRAQVVDECVVIAGIDDRSPLDHLVHFLRPCGFAEALLQDDPRLVALQAGRSGFGLHGTCRQIFGRLLLLPRRLDVEMLSDDANEQRISRRKITAHISGDSNFRLCDMDFHLIGSVVEIAAGIPYGVDG